MVVTEAVKDLIDGLELDKEGQARATIALALACKLDDCLESTSGVVAQATAGLAKELSATLDTIMESQVDSDDFVAGLFGRSAS